MKALEAVLGGPRFEWMRQMSAELPDLRWFVVGGAVRDALMGRDARADLDLIARGAPFADLQEALARHGSVDLVGRVFGVIKFRPDGGDETFDIALPRTELAGRSGGYKDFAVQADPMLPIDADLARRDFTVNAMAYDVASGALVDPFGGAVDLERKVVRAVGDPAERFAEDVSRALRGIRFACELGFEIEPGTLAALAKTVRRVNDLDAAGERLVPLETIAKELVRMFGAAPGRAAALCKEHGVFAALVPEVEALADCPQSPDYHSEGDVWRHTQLALEALSGREFDAETALAVLLHDIGKPSTLEMRDGRLTFYGHPDVGATMARAVCDRLRLSSYKGLVSADGIAELVRLHLLPLTLDLAAVRRTTLFKYFLKDRVFGHRLRTLAFADASAGIHADGTVDLGNLERLDVALAEMDRATGGAPAAALLTGEEVMAQAHLHPGPEVGAVLEELKEAQLRGDVTTHAQAVEFIRMRGERQG